MGSGQGSPDYEDTIMAWCDSYNKLSTLGGNTASKRAIEALIFIFFILYVVLTIVAYVLEIIRKESVAAYAAKKLLNEIAYKHWYVFFLLALYHVLEPWAFPVVMLWIYGIIFLIHCAMHFVFADWRQWILIITYAVVNLYAIFLTIILLADDWCSFFKGRGGYVAGGIAYS